MQHFRQGHLEFAAQLQLLLQLLFQLGHPNIKRGAVKFQIILPLADQYLQIRLDQIRGAVERVAAEAVIQPTRVTLRGEMKLSAALAALEEQTSNKVVDYRDRFGGVRAASHRAVGGPPP